MSEETPDSLIPYDSIVQEALRAVVGRVLGEIEQGGSELPGAHHFYITFKTHAPGVSIPANLRERFPDEMTIVLQNKFWNLNVREDGFAVGLCGHHIPKIPSFHSKISIGALHYRFGIARSKDARNVFCRKLIYKLTLHRATTRQTLLQSPAQSTIQRAIQLR